MSKRELALWRKAVWRVVLEEFNSELSVFAELWYGCLLDEGA